MELGPLDYNGWNPEPQPNNPKLEVELALGIASFRTVGVRPELHYPLGSCPELGSRWHSPQFGAQMKQKRVDSPTDQMKASEQACGLCVT